MSTKKKKTVIHLFMYLSAYFTWPVYQIYKKVVWRSCWWTINWSASVLISKCFCH